jgi:hypothetical protein
MRLYYVDESGNTGLNLDSPDQPVHWVVALEFTPHAVKAIEAEMQALALRVFPGRARDSDFEFHGSDIFMGRGDCSPLRVEERVALYGELLALVGRHGCALYLQGVDKARLRARADTSGEPPAHPHQLAFMHLLERIDEALERVQPDADTALYGLVMADEQKEMNREIVQRFAHWRHTGTERSGRARELKYLLDTIHYVPSHDSWLIQLVDCVAYVRNRYGRVLREKGSHEARYSESERTVVRLWRENCAERVVSDECWP